MARSKSPTKRNSPKASRENPRARERDRKAEAKAPAQRCKAPRRMSRLSQLLSGAGLRLKKGLGQNFLVNQGVLEKIVKATGATEASHIVEIGCGMGNLTEMLAREAGTVAAVELDERFRAIHKRELGDVENLAFFYGDFLEFSLSVLAPPERRGDLRVVGNIPYHLTSAILFKLITSRAPIQCICLLMQREVAQRASARPGNGPYGILAAKLAVGYETETVFQVSPGSFLPPPKVTSALVRLTPRPGAALTEDAAERQGFFDFVDAAFAQRRKMLCKSVAAVSGGQVERQAVLEALEACGLDPAVRAEVLAPEQLLELFRALGKPTLPSPRKSFAE